MNAIKKINTVDVLFVALAMSVGWGFRGNYGHEYGAMVPGALVAIAVCLISGREDWYRRIIYFGLFGAVAWAFGGQMSYGIIIGYTKSADLLTVFYGFGALFLIGLIWGGIGAAILGLVVILERIKLTEMIFPFLMIFGVWSVVNIFLLSKYGDTEPSVFYYYDTDIIAAVLALAALLITIGIQRKVTHAVSLALHITIGWLAGIFLFVTILDWHLSPPRSDNWAGALGVFIGLIIFLMRNKYWAALYASLFVALFSGIGFSTGQLFQVLGDTTGIRIDWWKIMEQSFGLIMGLGVGLAFSYLRFFTSEINEEEPAFDWGKGFGVFFLLVAMTYVNLEKNVTSWLKNGMVENNIFGLSAHFWFDVSYVLLSIIVIVFILSAKQKKSALLPESPIGKGQLLFLVVLWWAIIGDQFQAFLKFNYARLIVEGSFYISAILLSVWIAIRNVPHLTKFKGENELLKSKLKKIVLAILIVMPLVMIINTTFARLSHSGSLGGSHVRFKKSVQMDSEKQISEAIMSSEFIYEQAPFPSCHASTIEETEYGLIAAWFGGTNEKNPDVGIWVSRNNGEGWTEVAEVVNGVQNDELRYPCWNPVLFQPKDGPLMLFYKVGPSPREWWGMLTTSEDGGKTWSEPKRLPEGILGPIKNKPVQLPDGTILSGSSTESKADGWLVHMERSADLGKTWEKTNPLNDKYDYFAIQPTILTYLDGKLQILCRSKQKQITECWSTDGGKTWSQMRLSNLPNPNSGIDGVTLKDGKQLLVYNHTKKGRSPLNVAISKDGKDWKSVLVLEDQPGEYSYPAVIQTSDGMVHITYTWKRKKIKHVVVDLEKMKN